MSYDATLTQLDGTVTTTGRLHRTDLQLEHTGLNIATIAITDPDFDVLDLAFGDLDLDLDGSALFRGEITGIDEATPTDGVDTLKAFGPGYELTRNSPASPPTYTWETTAGALTDYYDNQAGSNISGTVTAPTAEIQRNDEETQGLDPNTMADITVDPAATTPIDITFIDNPVFGEVRLRQTAFTTEAEDASLLSGASEVSDLDYSGNTGVELNSNGDALELVIDPDYDIPAEDLDLWIRAESTEQREMTVTFSGETVTNNWSGSLALTWYNLSDFFSFTPSSDVSAGNHTLRIEAGASNGGADEFFLDALAPLDGRFTYQFTDDGGLLAGPEHYPNATADTEIEFVDEPESFAVKSARVDSTWTDTSGGQQITSSNNADTNTITKSNTADATFDFRSNGYHGDVVSTTARLGRYGSRSSPSPTEGFNGQVITDWSVFVTTDTTPIIRSVTLENNDFRNLATLHDGRFRYVIDPRQRDPISIASFADGDSGSHNGTIANDGSGAGGRVIDDSERRDVRGYANSVEVFYTNTVGNDETVVVTDDGEVTRIGTTIQKPVFTTGQLTDDEARNRARNEVLKATNQDQLAGSIDAWAAFIMPGYTYTVDEWGRDQSIERVQYTESGGDATMMLEFTEARDLTAKTVGYRGEIDRIKEDT